MIDTWKTPANSRLSALKRCITAHFSPGVLVVFLSALLVWFSSSCRVMLIADRDEAFVNRVLETARTVDALFLRMMSADTTQLQYSHYAKEWDEAELQIRQLRLMAEAHPLNTESSQICNLLLETFLKYKTQHRNQNTYPTALLPLHRDRLSEYFVALLSIEKSKEKRKP